jgi:hypothetical protein
MTREIPLSNGGVTLVDDSDYEWLIHLQWRNIQDRAQTRVWKDGKEHTFLMHRMILWAPKDMTVDHINGNPLDNRRCNLRLATMAENSRNQHRVRGSSSQYKGVTWQAKRGKWRAQLTVNYRTVFLGRYTCEIEAAKAYDRAAREHFGDFAALNFPELEQAS